MKKAHVLWLAAGTLFWGLLWLLADMILPGPDTLLAATVLPFALLAYILATLFLVLMLHWHCGGFPTAFPVLWFFWPFFAFVALVINSLLYQGN